MRWLHILAGGLILVLSAQADLIVGAVSAIDAVSFGDGGVSHCSTGATTAVDAGFNVSTDGAACFPSTTWSFVDNGTWLALPSIVDTSGTTTITIDLGGSWSMVWGMMDYYLACVDFECTYIGNDPTVSALDQDKNILETYDIAGVLNGSTSADFDYLAGDTVGISRSTSDIAYLQIGGDFLAMTNISLFTNTPEPATYWASGFVFAVSLFEYRRRRRKRITFPISDRP